MLTGLKRIYTVPFGILTAYLLVCSLFFWQDGPAVYASGHPVLMRGFLVAGALAAAVFFLLAYKVFEKKLTGRAAVIFVWIAFLLMICLQILFLMRYKALLRYDALKVYDEAVSVFSAGGISGVSKDGYFAMYTNNHPAVLFTFLCLKAGRMLHFIGPDFSKATLYLQAINLICLDLAFFAGYLFVKDVCRDKAAAHTYLLYLLLQPVTYLFPAFYYTNTIAMPFMMWGLYLLGRVIFPGADHAEGKDGIEKITKNSRTVAAEGITDIATVAAAGICLGIAFLLRATSGITAIAGVMLLMLYRKGWKKKAFFTAFLCIALLLPLLPYRMLEHRYAPFDTRDSAFPAIHWVMMGAKGNGTFNKQDEVFTAYFQTAEDKRNADRNLLRQRLEQLGAAGYGKLMFGKLNLTFGDGLDNMPQELSVADWGSRLYPYISGRSRTPFVLYQQILYLICFAGGLLLCFAGRKAHGKPWEFLMLNLLGAYLFYMIWEAGSVYSMSFQPLFPALVVCGLGAVAGGDLKTGRPLEPAEEHKKSCNVQEQEIIRKYMPGMLVCAGLLAAGLCVAGKAAGLTSEPDYRVNQYQFESDHYAEAEVGKAVKQSFVSDGDFDHVSVQIRNPMNEEASSSFRMQLLDSKGELVEEETFSMSELVDCQFAAIKLDRVMGAGSYYLQLEKTEGQDPLIFLCYDTGHYDAYNKGMLTGMTESEMADLCFKVYLGEEKESYFEEFYREHREN